MGAEPARRPKVVTQTGEEVVHLDLDEVFENEATETPFTFRAGGRIFTAISPDDADWQATADTDTPGGLRAFMRELLGEEDYDRFCAVRVTNKQLGRLVEGAQKHYGITAGESRASARSSRNTRGR